MPGATREADEVRDALLHGLAVKVAEQHQPAADQPDRCANLRCAGESYPCAAARDAERARRLAIDPPAAGSRWQPERGVGADPLGTVRPPAASRAA